tara:strand:- start:589 stop:1308 length:720 start_codon:yes stop_codon:yes gene_type:complete
MKVLVMLWHEIYTDLFQELHDGIIVVGQKLPTEAVLSKRFSANRHTVRRALSQLRSDGLVHTKRGRGTIAVAPPLTYRIGRKTRFSTNLDSTASIAGISILHMLTRLSSESEARILNFGKSEAIHYVEGLRLRDGRPLLHFTSIFPARRVGDLLIHLNDGLSITQALAASGIDDYERKKTRITARIASERMAGHLEIYAGDPVLVVKSLNTLPDGTIIESGHSTMAGDRIALVVDGDRN